MILREFDFITLHTVNGKTDSKFLKKKERENCSKRYELMSRLGPTLLMHIFEDESRVTPRMNDNKKIGHSLLFKFFVIYLAVRDSLISFL